MGRRYAPSNVLRDALPGHLPPDAASQERVGTINSWLEEIGSLYPRPLLFGICTVNEAFIRPGRREMPSWWNEVSDLQQMPKFPTTCSGTLGTNRQRTGGRDLARVAEIQTASDGAGLPLAAG